MSGIYDVLTEVTERRGLPKEYWDKMMHPIPNTPVMDRAEYLLKAARGKSILDIGGGYGPMSDKLREVAGDYHSVDKVACDKPGHYQVDLDDSEQFGPAFYEIFTHFRFDVIIMGEVLEHLSNPGHLLDYLAGQSVPVIITVPNCGMSPYRFGKNLEHVNPEHVAWYSYHTLKTLVERHGFRVLAWFWCGGKPFTSEGLIFHMESNNGTT